MSSAPKRRGRIPNAVKEQMAQAAAQAAVAEPESVLPPVVESVEDEGQKLSAYDRLNPAKLSGDDLKHLGHQMGMARSLMASMPDDKIRIELSYLIRRKFEEMAEG